VVLDLVDSLALNLETRRHRVPGLVRLAYELEYHRMRSYERAALARFPALIVTSQADAKALGQGNKVHILPMGVDLDRFAFHGPGGRDPATLIFTGNMGYQPNEEAVFWFAEQVWPLVRVSHPQARWHIVGTNPGERVRALAGEASSGIEVLGWVPEMSHYLGQATLAVCPLRSGSGIQMKVQEAMATGTPVVATSVANRGVGAVPERDLLIADSPVDFATAVARLFDDPNLRARLAQAGRTFVGQHFSWEEHAQQLSAIYSSVLAQSK
jgi:glycosyltransferase involved in cell wall biosynthesis